MNYIDKTKDGLINSKNVVKLYDIVLLRKGYWKNKLAIITATKPETKHIHLRVIENGMDMSFSLKDVIFVNHNTKAAAKAYFDSLPDSVLNSKEFSNARFVRNLFERTWAKAAMRSQLNGSKSIVLTKDDFERSSADKEFKIIMKKTVRLGFV